MPTIEESIEDFCSYFQSQTEMINNLTINNPNVDSIKHQIRFYKKTLIITHIDTFSGIRFTEKRYPQINKKNRDRFVQFLEISGAWPSGSLVSIPFLVEYANDGKLSDGQLKRYIDETLSEKLDQANPNLPAIAIDQHLDKLIALSSTELEQKAILECRHYELMYRYRNYLVHESQEPGNAMEVIEEDDAYYHSYIGEDKLFLAYPLELFQNILSNSLSYLESYLLENKIDPYKYVKETARW